MYEPLRIINEHPWTAALGVLIAGTTVQDTLQLSSRLQDLGIRKLTVVLLSPSNWWAGGFLAWILTGRTLFMFFFYACFYFFAVHPKPGPAARGDLQQSIEDLGAKAGVEISDSSHWAWDETNVCIVHDTFRWWTSTAARAKYVFVPMRYLGWMSRTEIDAIVARQLVEKNAPAQEPWFIPMLVYTCIVGVGTSVLHLNGSSALIFMAVAVVVEIGALLVVWPYLDLQNHLRAIQLTGNAEAYISALSELSRLNKSCLDTGMLAKIASKTSVSQQKLLQLIGPVLRPAENQYCVDPRYFRTGR